MLELVPRSPTRSSSTRTVVFQILNSAASGAGDADDFSFVPPPAQDSEHQGLLRQGAGDAPHYPDWVYRLVILPRLLWQEQQRIAQLAEVNHPTSVQRIQTAPFETFLDDSRFGAPYDFEWWLDEEVEGQVRDLRLDRPPAAPVRRWLDRFRDAIRRRR